MSPFQHNRSRPVLKDSADFIGHVPDAYGLKGKDATTQLSTLAKTWDYSTSDVVCETSANRKSVYLNCLFWAHHDFSESDVSRQQRGDFISNLKKLWEFNHVEVPLPGELSENATRSFHVGARTSLSGCPTSQALGRIPNTTNRR